jgi:hypothetical protein
MAGFRQHASMAYSDDEILDQMRPSMPEPREYPGGLSFTISAEDVERCGGEGECRPGDVIDFAMMIQASAVERKIDGCRIEGQIMMLSLGDNPLVEMPDDGMRPCICLLDGDMERLDLDDDAASGDLLHLIGRARVEATNESQYSSGKRATFQIIEASVEDEDQEDAGDR